jgi:uncharacterized membrane protein
MIFYGNILMASAKLMKISRIYILLLGATIVWCGLIVAAPMIASAGHPLDLSKGIYCFFGAVCHQIDSRSLHIGGEKLAVCARCSSTYFSFLAMLVLYPILSKLTMRDSRLWFLTALLPMLVDVALDFAGIHASTIPTRVFTGAFFGAGAAYLLLPDLEEALAGLFTTLKNYLN